MFLELNDINYAYHSSGKTVLNCISCTISAGEFIVLRGANGSGKSTLAKIIAGLINPDSGSINGWRNKGQGWNGVGLVMQDPASQLLTSSVEEEIAWGLENLAVNRKEIIQQVEKVIDEFGLEQIRRKAPESLSDGEKQIVAFVVNFVLQPDILILDETTAYLDLQWRRKILTSAISATKSCAVIWITSRNDDPIKTGTEWQLVDGKLTIRNT